MLEQGAIALDIRDGEEHGAGSIQGVLNISRGKFEMNVAAQIADLDTIILCFCNANNRGALSAVALQSMGYTNAKYIARGLKAYRTMKA